MAGSADYAGSYRSSMRQRGVDLADSIADLKSGAVRSSVPLTEDINAILKTAENFYKRDLDNSFRAGALMGALGQEYKLDPEDLKFLMETKEDGLKAVHAAGAQAKRDARRIASSARAGKLSERGRDSAVRGVRYSDGRWVNAAAYSDMRVATDSAIAYNTGALKGAAHAGVKWVQIHDGPGCGMSGHDSGGEANGQIVDLQTAMVNLISHPYCTRTFEPLPDYKSPKIDPKKKERAKKVAVRIAKVNAAVAGLNVAAAGAGIAKNSEMARRIIAAATRGDPWSRVFQYELNLLVHKINQQFYADTNVIDIRTGLPVKEKIDVRKLALHANDYQQDIAAGRAVPQLVREALALREVERRYLKAVGEHVSHLGQFVDRTVRATLSIADAEHLDDLTRRTQQAIFDWIGPRSYGERFMKFTMPDLGGYGRRPRVNLVPDNDKVKATLTLTSKRGVVPDVRVNPNGLVRAGFQYDPDSGLIFPNLSIVPKGPIRIETKLNRSGGFLVKTDGSNMARAKQFATQWGIPHEAIVPGERLGTGAVTSMSVKVSFIMKMDIGIFRIANPSLRFNMNLRKLGLNSLSDVRGLRVGDLAKTGIPKELIPSGHRFFIQSSDGAWANLGLSDVKAIKLGAEMRMRGFGPFDFKRFLYLDLPDAIKFYELSGKEIMHQILIGPYTSVKNGLDTIRGLLNGSLYIDKDVILHNLQVHFGPYLTETIRALRTKEWILDRKGMTRWGAVVQGYKTDAPVSQLLKNFNEFLDQRAARLYEVFGSEHRYKELIVYVRDTQLETLGFLGIKNKSIPDLIPEDFFRTVTKGSVRKSSDFFKYGTWLDDQIAYAHRKGIIPLWPDLDRTFYSMAGPDGETPIENLAEILRRGGQHGTSMDDFTPWTFLVDQFDSGADFVATKVVNDGVQDLKDFLARMARFPGDEAKRIVARSGWPRTWFIPIQTKWINSNLSDAIRFLEKVAPTGPKVKLSRFTPNSPEDSFFASFYREFGDTVGRITFNGDFLDDLGKLDQRVLDSITNNWFNKGSVFAGNGAQQTLIHEYGHAVADQIFMLGSKERAMRFADVIEDAFQHLADEAIAAGKGATNYEWAMDSVSDAVDKFKKELLLSTNERSRQLAVNRFNASMSIGPVERYFADDITEAIGTYATRNLGETLAEAWATRLLSSQPSEFVRILGGEMLDQVQSVKGVRRTVDAPDGFGNFIKDLIAGVHPTERVNDKDNLFRNFVEHTHDQMPPPGPLFEFDEDILRVTTIDQLEDWDEVSFTRVLTTEERKRVEPTLRYFETILPDDWKIHVAAFEPTDPTDTTAAFAVSFDEGKTAVVMLRQKYLQPDTAQDLDRRVNEIVSNWHPNTVQLAPGSMGGLVVGDLVHEIGHATFNKVILGDDLAAVDHVVDGIRDAFHSMYPGASNPVTAVFEEIREAVSDYVPKHKEVLAIVDDALAKFSDEVHGRYVRTYTDNELAALRFVIKGWDELSSREKMWEHVEMAVTEAITHLGRREAESMVSRYGATSLGELLAESWTSYHLSPVSERSLFTQIYGKHIMEALTDHIDGVHFMASNPRSTAITAILDDLARLPVSAVDLPYGAGGQSLYELLRTITTSVDGLNRFVASVPDMPRAVIPGSLLREMGHLSEALEETARYLSVVSPSLGSPVGLMRLEQAVQDMTQSLLSPKKIVYGYAHRQAGTGNYYIAMNQLLVGTAEEQTAILMNVLRDVEHGWFNRRVPMFNVQDMQRATLVHEYGHIITYDLFEKAALPRVDRLIDGVGSAFRDLMYTWGSRNPDRLAEVDQMMNKLNALSEDYRFILHATDEDLVDLGFHTRIEARQVGGITYERLLTEFMEDLHWLGVMGDLRTQVSGYATSSAGELFAEVWQAFHLAADRTPFVSTLGQAMLEAAR